MTGGSIKDTIVSFHGKSTMNKIIVWSIIIIIVVVVMGLIVGSISSNKSGDTLTGKDGDAVELECDGSDVIKTATFKYGELDKPAASVMTGALPGALGVKTYRLSAGVPAFAPAGTVDPYPGVIKQYSIDYTCGIPAPTA